MCVCVCVRGGVDDYSLLITKREKRLKIDLIYSFFFPHMHAPIVCVRIFVFIEVCVRARVAIVSL